MMIIISASSDGEGKIYTYGFEKVSVDTLEELSELANRKSISGSIYKNEHRKGSNIIAGSNVILIDCDAPSQAEAVEERIRHYDYIKVPSASNSEATPYKWHFFIPTQTPLSVYPAAMKFQVEQFFHQVGITDDMIDTTGSYDIARQFAPASIKMDPDEADDLSTVNETDLQVPIVDAPEEFFNKASKSVTTNIKGIVTQKLPSKHLWFKGKAITYADTTTAVEEAYRTRESDDDKVRVSGFGCPHDNHDHTGDITSGYGFAFMGRDGNVIVKCTGNACEAQPYFVVSEFIEPLPIKYEKIKPELKPIHPKDFTKMMKNRLMDLNPSFIVGDKLEEAFYQFDQSYNECITLNRKDKPQTIVLPSATGSGKSVSAKLYLANIAKLGFSGLLVVSEVATAIEAALEINALAGKDVAGVFYSVSDKNLDHKLRCKADDLPQIAIITHSMFIQRSDSGKDIDFLKNYDNKQRDCIVIDERIDLTKRISFSTNEIPDAVAILKRDPKLKDVATTLEDMNELIYLNKDGFNARAEYKDEFKTLSQQASAKFKALSEALKEGKYDVKQRLRGYKKDDKEDRYNTANLLARIAFVTAGKYSNTQEGKRIVCHREEDLSGAFGSAVVLDATATVNPEYQMRLVNDKPIKFLERIQARDYTPVILNLCRLNGMNQSRYYVTKDVVDAYVKLIKDNIPLTPDDKLLVVTYKSLVPKFKDSCPDENITFVHWGSKEARGSNEFSDYNKALAIGFFRKPQHSYIASIMTINDIDDYISVTGSVWSDANYLKDKLIADDMIQFFNRVRCRVSTDKDGKCKPTELYMFTGGNEKLEKIITDSTVEEMPGINIKPWKVTLPTRFYAKRKQTKVEKRADTVIEYLRGNIDKWEHIDQKDIMNYFGFSSTVMKKLFNLEYFNARLEEENIYAIRLRQRGSPIRFMLPINRSFNDV